MAYQDVEWISAHLHGKDIRFPNDTTWRLAKVLAEKDAFLDECPAELQPFSFGSNIVVCNQAGKLWEEFICSMKSSICIVVVAIKSLLELRAQRKHCIWIQNIEPRKLQKRLQRTLYTKMEITANISLETNALLLPSFYQYCRKSRILRCWFLVDDLSLS